MTIYSLLLYAHSWCRWLVLATLLYAIVRSWRGWKSGRTFGAPDNRARYAAVAAAHLQLALGLGLYFISPIVGYFLNDFSAAVHQREMRFFGMEHSLMMSIGVIVLTIGGVKTKRREEDREKFRTMTIWFAVALFIILTSIPWSFSPLTSRPLFRW